MVTPSSEAAKPRLGSETILVVEDEVMLRAMVVRALSQSGYRVSEAGSAKEVLTILEEGGELPQLLLTDVAATPSECNAPPEVEPMV